MFFDESIDAVDDDAAAAVVDDDDDVGWVANVFAQQNRVTLSAVFSVVLLLLVDALFFVVVLYCVV